MLKSYMADSRGAELSLGSMFDRRADAHVGPAAANVSRHGRINVRIFGVRGGVEQRRRRHDLPGLAVAALDHLQIQPCLLHLRAGRGGADALDGRDRALADRPHRQETGAYRRAVDMHGAGAALRYAAPELGAGETQDIAQHPQQGHVGRSIDIPHFAVYFQTDHDVPREGRQWFNCRALVEDYRTTEQNLPSGCDRIVAMHRPAWAWASRPAWTHDKIYKNSGFAPSRVAWYCALCATWFYAEWYDAAGLASGIRAVQRLQQGGDQIDGQWEHDGRTLFAGNVGQRLQIAQLQRRGLSR